MLRELLKIHKILCANYENMNKMKISFIIRNLNLNFLNTNGLVSTYSIAASIKRFLEFDIIRIDT